MREKKLKRAAETVRAPQNREEAEKMLARLGAIQREQKLLSAALDETIAAERARAEAKNLPLKTESEGLLRGIQMWAEANRATLTREGRTKTVTLATGLIAWRTLPSKVKIKDEPGVLERLAKLGLGRFIRIKQEINREAMLAEPSVARTVDGVTIGSAGEEFVVSPLTEQVAA